MKKSFLQRRVLPGVVFLVSSTSVAYAAPASTQAPGPSPSPTPSSSGAMSWLDQKASETFTAAEQNLSFPSGTLACQACDADETAAPSEAQRSATSVLEDTLLGGAEPYAEPSGVTPAEPVQTQTKADTKVGATDSDVCGCIPRLWTFTFRMTLEQSFTNGKPNVPKVTCPDIKKSPSQDFTEGVPPFFGCYSEFNAQLKKFAAQFNEGPKEVNQGLCTYTYTQVAKATVLDGEGCMLCNPSDCLPLVL